MSLAGIGKLARPHQWVKNVFVLAALFFTHGMMISTQLWSVLDTLIAFCLISSAVYVLNDIVDADQDRMHPKKMTRPIASGQVSIPAALTAGAMLLVTGLGIGWVADYRVAVVLCAYFVINILYSCRLKQVVLLDVFLIALGFDLRVIAGSVAARETPSPWLLVCTLLLALFLGLCKRRAELIQLTDTMIRPESFAAYDRPFLDQLISMMAAATMMAYAMYAINGSITHWMIITIPLVIYAFFRYLHLVYQQKWGDEPIRVLFEDRPFLVVCTLWIVSSFVLVHTS